MRQPKTVPTAAATPTEDAAAIGAALKKTAKQRQPSAAIALSIEFVGESRSNQVQARNAIMKAVLSAGVALRMDAEFDVREALTAAKVPLGTVKLIARIAPRVAVDDTIKLPTVPTRESITTAFDGLPDELKATRKMVAHYGLGSTRVIDNLAALRRILGRLKIEERPQATEAMLAAVSAWKAEQVKAGKRAAAA